VTGGLSVLSDAPSGESGDRLEFSRYIAALTDLIVNDATQTPFSVGVFGAWGSGKSSLLRMLNESLTRDHPDDIVLVDFNPWVYRHESSMLVPLLLTLQDSLKQDREQRFLEIAGNIGGLLVKVTAGVLLGRLSSAGVTLDSVDRLADELVHKRGEVESETRNLRDALQKQADAIKQTGARLVFIIDDLDRCEPDEIIDLLESIKLFLDLRHVFIIIAVAKDVVDRGIAFKYRDFGFTLGEVLAVGDEYLDKMIQLPLYIPPIDHRAIGTFMRGLQLPDVVGDQVDLLERIVSPNPRRIKRVLNMCAVTYAISGQSPGLEDLRPDLVARLAVLRVQSAELFSAIARDPDLLVALELLYQGKLKLDPLTGFTNRFGARRAEALRDSAARFRDSQEYLQSLFGDSVFDSVAADLPRYLTMLGGMS
jgi:energy-coupling factor transporter ATP-binding protein EcfA2